MDSLESRLGYSFKNPRLLVEALTHPSLGHETKRAVSDNQRLEYLGDAVLQLILSEALFHRMPSSKEGMMTRARIRLVSEKALSEKARQLHLGTDLRMGRGDESQGGRNRDSSLADAMEAVIGAIYLDAGMEQSRSVLLKLFDPEINAVIADPDDKNPKGQLQEQIQGVGAVAPTYTLVSQDGPDHEKIFHVLVTHGDITLGEGRGRNKKEAEVDAARSALRGGPLKTLLLSLGNQRH